MLLGLGIQLMPYTGQSGGPSSTYTISLDISYAILIAVLVLFVAMYLALRANTRSKRALDGFREAIFVDAAFLLVSVVVVAVLWLYDRVGNHVAYTVAQVILGGLWLTFAIPVVTVGFSVHTRTRGQVAWIVPSLLFAAGLFVVLYYWTYNHP